MLIGRLQVRVLLRLDTVVLAVQVRVGARFHLLLAPHEMVSHIGKPRLLLICIGLGRLLRPHIVRVESFEGSRLWLVHRHRLHLVLR